MAASSFISNPNGTTCYNGGVAVTPSDTVPLVTPARGLVATVAGTISVQGLDGNAFTFQANAGVVYTIGATRVNATNTTATGIVALL